MPVAAPRLLASRRPLHAPLVATQALIAVSAAAAPAARFTLTSPDRTWVNDMSSTWPISMYRPTRAAPW